MDHYTRCDIESDIERIRTILGCGIFAPENARHPLFQSALTELLIRLRDLLAKSENYAQRIAFSDDVTIKGSVTDVTALVAFIRDAVCHIDSGKHNHDEFQARISFNTAFGAGCLIKFGDTRIESEYEDDVAFFFGPHRIYLKRHIARAFNEAVELLQPMLEAR
jgi:hypothetical protein